MSWQRPWLIPFAEDPELRLGKLKILELEIECLLGAQAVEQHEGDQSQIAEGAKATPNFATSSADSGTITRCGSLSRSPVAIMRRGRP